MTFQRRPKDEYPLRYPAREDFDPATIPYPFSLRLQRGLGQACLALAVGLGAGAAAADGPKAPENPFDPTDITFSYVPSHFGTGLPRQLTEGEALPVIREVFAKAGLKLGRDVKLADPAVSLEMDGLSADGKLGFEYLTARDKAYYRSVNDEALLKPKTLPAPLQTLFDRTYWPMYQAALEAACKQHQVELEQPQIAELLTVFKNTLLQVWKARKTHPQIQMPDQRRVSQEVNRRVHDYKRWLAIDVKGLSPAERQHIGLQVLRGQRYYALIDGKRYEYHGTSAKALQRLRKDVEQFLAWARSQGAF